MATIFLPEPAGVIEGGNRFARPWILFFQSVVRALGLVDVVTPTLFANLPALPQTGQLAQITDSSTATWGATIAGGGANTVFAVFNGTNWTVFGK